MIVNTIFFTRSWFSCCMRHTADELKRKMCKLKVEPKNPYLIRIRSNFRDTLPESEGLWEFSKQSFEQSAFTRTCMDKHSRSQSICTDFMLFLVYKIQNLKSSLKQLNSLSKWNFHLSEVNT